MAARSVGIRVEKFYIGFNLFGLGIKKKYGDTEYGIGLFPLGGYVKVAGILDESMDSESTGSDDEFRAKNTFQKIWFLSAGVIMNFILSSFIFAIFVFVNGYTEIVDKPIIKEVQKTIFYEDLMEKEVLSPAFSLGLLPGDKILAINSIEVNTWTEMSNIIHNNPNKSIRVKWNSYEQNKIFENEITTFMRPAFKDGKMKNIGILGISPDYNLISAGVFLSAYKCLEQTSSWINLMFSSLWALVTGNISVDQMSGPLGIATVAGDTAQNGGIIALFMLMAIISVNLGIINILPIPGLDGGHVFIAIIEGLRRKELPLKVKYGIQSFGFILIMILFVFVFFNDIRNLM